MDRSALESAHCEPRKPDDVISAARVGELLTLLPEWQAAHDGKSIFKTFRFKNFYETLGFINAVGWMANRQDHHPDLEAGYNRCTLHWSTHDAGGLSMNDFICAAKAEAIAKA